MNMLSVLFWSLVAAALLVSSALLWSTKALPTIAGVSVVGAAGYILAIYFGWRLVRAIKRSGRLDSST